MLPKGLYPYEYVDNWEKFNETLLPEKEDFYSLLKMEDITDAYYAHAKRIYKDFQIKKLWENHYLYVQSNTLLFADVFENFQNMCLKIHELDPTRFFLPQDKHDKQFYKYESRIRTFNWYRYVINGRNSY